TSRETLRIAGELDWRVPSLTVPGADLAVTVEDVMPVESVRLFADRARAVQSGFTITTPSAALVAQICRRLDGIPLGIELAAALVQALTVEQITARLDDRFRLLTGRNRIALPRQQTLRAAMDWSYQLLTESERTLLRRLAVFAGDWTLEAAKTVGAGDG